MEDPIKENDSIKVFETNGESWLQRLIIYAAGNPWEFCWYLLLGLSPLFCISAYLSWKLAKALKAQEKEKNKKNRRNKNVSKVKRGKSD